MVTTFVWTNTQIYFLFAVLFFYCLFILLNLNVILFKNNFIVKKEYFASHINVVAFACTVVVIFVLVQISSKIIISVKFVEIFSKISFIWGILINFTKTLYSFTFKGFSW